jgi:hypothetical protein
MAIATSIRSFASVFNSGVGGWVNVTLGSTTGISAATPLTVTSAATGATLTLTPYQELPFLGYKCRIAASAPLHAYLFIRGGDTVTG